jgi:riboflavin synthase
MFTGIIENIGKIINIEAKGTNLDFTIESTISNELKIDQSVAHNGVCLTVVSIKDNYHIVTAINETLQKTNLSSLKVDDFVNLERAMQVNSRFDGHFVQGHVDQVATCISITDNNGSWIFTFQYDSSLGNITVEKGSICINGVSLTVLNSEKGKFSVAIIPYTYENTIFKFLKVNDIVNLEFDMIGKYIVKLFGIYNKALNETQN